MERSKIRLLALVGARPNFMKMAPLLRELETRGRFETTLVHTGQHYDASMSGDFFRELGIPEPDVNLAVGSGSHAAQTAQVLVGVEEGGAEQGGAVLGGDDVVRTGRGGRVMQGGREEAPGDNRLKQNTARASDHLRHAKFALVSNSFSLSAHDRRHFLANRSQIVHAL